jgi:hypothetical protein
VASQVNENDGAASSDCAGAVSSTTTTASARER